ncbi:isoprenyl transferase [Bacillus carboniphilus]|uniref:Isoprenyl transferase n=1 Tax=Bacillus carboniphilus TaxID=86663 RepID=A0ABY9JYC2_9BACI|nr:isoprenyl transferase [Bacillus carboniphilus]WLR43513.1 isoprenyl transferase [Bacillus carboniphilus]
MFKWLKKNRQLYPLVEEDIFNGKIPEHIAIIMDGNGRWAQKRSLPRVAGHHEGMKVVRKVTKLASHYQVKALTLYAFSTENWKRPKTEVEYLMKLPGEFLSSFLPELIEQNVKVRVTGDLSQIPEHTRKIVNKAIKDTSKNSGLVLNFALNYGSRTEIVHAVKEAISCIEKGEYTVDQFDEEKLTQCMMTYPLPDPDLLIRTSGEIRLSNFMLWQLAYTEFYFTDVLWPDFNEEHLIQAIKEYQQRGRRYGGV